MNKEMLEQAKDIVKPIVENKFKSISDEVTNNLAFWLDFAAQENRNKEYYRNLLIQCGEIIGKKSYISDDGSVQDEVLCAKIPELVKKLVEE